jgi:hypothetical protein
MSFTRENVVSVVSNNPDEVAGILNCMHVLGPAMQAFSKLCSDNKIRPLRRTKGQYCQNKRAPSAYICFTQANKDHKQLKGLPFADRAKAMGAMWTKTLANDGDHAKYVKMAADIKAEREKEKVPSEEVVVVVVADAVAEGVVKAPKVAKVAKAKVVKVADKPAKKAKGNAKAKAKKVAVVVADVGDDSEIDIVSDSD